MSAYWFKQWSVKVTVYMCILYLKDKLSFAKEREV